MAKRKPIEQIVIVGDMMPADMAIRLRPENFMSTRWFEPKDMTDEIFEYRTDADKEHWLYWQAKKRQEAARLEYLATLPVRPADVWENEWLRAHGVVTQMERMKPENKNRTFYAELGLKPPSNP